MKQHTELILSTGTSGFSMPLCYLSMSLLKEMCVCVCLPTCTHTRPRERTRKKLKLDWDSWEVIFFLNHHREELTACAVHPSGTECLGIRGDPGTQWKGIIGSRQAVLVSKARGLKEGLTEARISHLSQLSCIIQILLSQNGRLNKNQNLPPWYFVDFNFFQIFGGIESY